LRREQLLGGQRELNFRADGVGDAPARSLINAMGAAS